MPAGCGKLGERAQIGLPSMRTTLLASALIVIAACEVHDRDPAGPDAAAVACDVPGGVCPAGMMCVHVCDCCGIPPDVDAGIVPSGHDTCAPPPDHCDGVFVVEGRACNCLGDREASCPCA